MSSINYKDLQYIIIEYDIDTINQLLKDKERVRSEKNGVEIIDATNDQIRLMHQ